MGRGAELPESGVLREFLSEKINSVGGNWIDFGGYLSRSLTETVFTILSWFPAIIPAMYQQVRISQIAADETRECENCRVQMRQLGMLRAIGARPSIKVYHCYECNRIASEPIV